MPSPGNGGGESASLSGTPMEREPLGHLFNAFRNSFLYIACREPFNAMKWKPPTAPTIDRRRRSLQVPHESCNHLLDPCACTVACYQCLRTTPSVPQTQGEG
uniref:Uncharacterized protein n=1 Tax=Eutreptiella gymnastica TaxID=73025 RepID=A0A7S1HT46_9EUGL|mmetsp:Transcript_103210/g.177906  ORF Transcript_103210/g.177906 Transcript_103210/m.177906 type:complete len:102 (+) Transcript_103210:195-500(+)